MVCLHVLLGFLAYPGSAIYGKPVAVRGTVWFFELHVIVQPSGVIRKHMFLFLKSVRMRCLMFASYYPRCLMRYTFCRVG